MGEDILKKLIVERSELAQYKEQILDLFNECYPAPLDQNLWDWAYMQNPSGDAIVALAFDQGDRLVGHYAIIPVLFELENRDVHKLYLSMTTMVSPRFVRRGLFQMLAEMVYAHVLNTQKSAVYGFPNKNSINGFKKRLSWFVFESGIATLSIHEAAEIISRRQRKYSYFLGGAQLDWRLSKPGADYVVEGDCIIKKSKFGIDLLSGGNNKALLELSNEKNINLLLLPQEIQEFNIERINSYPIGFRNLGLPLDGIDSFDVSMIMSDVF